MAEEHNSVTDAQVHDGALFGPYSGPVTPEKLAAQREALDRAERCLADIRWLADFRIDDPGVTAH